MRIPALSSATARFAVTLAIGLAGGYGASLLGVVGGWLIGGLVAVLAAGWAGFPVFMPAMVRSVALAFAGIMTGATVTGTAFTGSGVLPWTVTALVALTLTLMALSFVAHRLIWSSSAATAFYSSWPGNTLLALVGAESSAADVDRVILVQSARIFLLVVILPLAIGVFHSAAEAAPGRIDADLLAAMPIAALSSWIALRLRILGGEMFLTAIAIGLLVMSGRLQIALPAPAISFFQVVVGGFIAINLARCKLSSLRSALAPSLAGAGIGAVLTFLFAFPLAAWLDVSPAALALAFAPGGAEPMILLSAVFGVDPGFVGLHHTVRLIGLTLVFPLLARFTAPAGVS
jgi:membrane AbrB-like protein